MRNSPRVKFFGFCFVVGWDGGWEWGMGGVWNWMGMGGLG